MLVRLTPGQANDFWPVLKWHIAKALPYGENDKRFGSLLSAVNRGILDVFVFTDTNTPDTTESNIKAVITTTINIDCITGLKHFVIYTLTGQDGLSSEDLTNGLRGLKNYAKSINCDSIIAYTVNAKVLSLSAQLGFKQTSTVLTLEI